jgi:hypothetical protein
MSTGKVSPRDENVKYHAVPSDPEIIEVQNEPSTRQDTFRRRMVLTLFTLVVFVYMFRSQLFANLRFVPSISLWSDRIGCKHDEAEKVPLEIHIMSKCPDARDCLRDLIVPTMVEASDKVNLTMSFIGRSVQTCSCAASSADHLLVSTPNPTPSRANMGPVNAWVISSYFAQPKSTPTPSSGWASRIA